MIGPFDADDDATPLTVEERNGQIPTHIALRSERKRPVNYAA